MGLRLPGRRGAAGGAASDPVDDDFADEIDEDWDTDADPVGDFGEVDDEPALPVPSRMAGREPLQGYVATAVLLAIGVANLAITTGKGAPAHPTLWYSYVGLALAVGLGVSIRYRNRLVSPFVAIFAAFFLTLAKGPDVLGTPHLVALVVAVGYALVLSMHQRRDQKALSAATGIPMRRSRRDRRQPPSAPGADDGLRRPRPNRRYTPPKAVLEAEKAKRSSRSRRR